MQILPRTVKSELQQRGMLAKMVPLLDAVEKELGERWLANTALAEFAILSTRVKFDEGEVDFPQLAYGDTASDVEGKFRRYLDTTCVESVQAALDRVEEADKPSDPALGPQAPAAKDKAEAGK